MSDDDRPTPDLGYPVQPEPRRRMRSNPLGVPILEITERPSRRVIQVEPTSEEPDSQDEIPPESALTALVRREVKRESARSKRWLWRALVALAIPAFGSFVAVLAKMLDSREADGVDKQRLKYLEQEVMLLRSREREPYPDRYRPGPWRRDDQPDPVPWTPAAPVTPPSVTPPAPTPARKEPP